MTVEYRSSVDTPPARPVMVGLWRGLGCRCPNCGTAGQVFRRYLTVATRCDQCGEALGRYRADDAPPYFTIFLVGHLVIPLVLLWEKLAPPPIWLHLAVWLPLTLALTLLLLRPVKGATLGVMWSLGIRGDESQDGSGAVLHRTGDPTGPPAPATADRPPALPASGPGRLQKTGDQRFQPLDPPLTAPTSPPAGSTVSPGRHSLRG